jgi:hypothetical protein
VKIRRTIVGGSRVYDDIDPSEKIKIYDKGIDVAEMLEQVQTLRVSYRTGDIWAPNLDTYGGAECAGGPFLRLHPQRHAAGYVRPDGLPGRQCSRTGDAFNASKRSCRRYRHARTE